MRESGDKFDHHNLGIVYSTLHDNAEDFTNDR